MARTVSAGAEEKFETMRWMPVDNPNHGSFADCAPVSFQLTPERRLQPCLPS